MALVYRHIRLDKNEPFYIGIGLTEKRAYTKKGRNKLWKNVVSKSDYEVEILMDGLTWKQACEKEKEFIKLYGRKDLKTGTLCNLTCGGDGVIDISEEARYKIGNGNRGIPRTEKVKEKISSKNKGRKVSKYSILKGIETRIKNGTINRSDETKRKLSIINKKKVIRYKLEDLSDMVIYNSIKEAQIENNLFNISEVCNGNRKSSGGYKWKFYE